MLTRSRILLAILWALSLVVVGQWAHAEGNSQRADPMILEQAGVYSGAEIGFRAYQPLAGEPVGRLVVRMNGQWKEVEIRPSQPK